MSTRTILVAIELDTWQPIVAVARDMATRYDAELVVLHVVTPMLNAYPDLPAGLFAEAKHEVDCASRRVVEEIARDAGARASLRLGAPAEEILAAIAEVEPIQLVLGTRGRHGVKRMLLGSVAEHVVRSSPIPVTIVPAGATLAA
ncbi:MAG: universal stress protein [Polyangiaceae bacterium]